MDKKVEKKNKVKIIIVVLLVISVASVGAYFVYNKSKSKGTNAENGASVSGYVLADGAEPGLSEDEIRALLQKQVDDSTISFSISSDPVFKGKKAFIVMANPSHPEEWFKDPLSECLIDSISCICNRQNNFFPLSF